MPSLLPRNMLLIARREYLEQIRGRAFRLSTILVPLLVIFLLGVSTVTGRKLAAHRHIAIAADNPALAADIRSDLTQEKRAGYTADVVAPFTAQDRADLQARVANKSLDGLLVVENSSGGTPMTLAWARFLVVTMVTSWVTGTGGAGVATCGITAACAGPCGSIAPRALAACSGMRGAFNSWPRSAV